MIPLNKSDGIEGTKVHTSSLLVFPWTILYDILNGTKMNKGVVQQFWFFFTFALRGHQPRRKEGYEYVLGNIFLHFHLNFFGRWNYVNGDQQLVHKLKVYYQGSILSNELITSPYLQCNVSVRSEISNKKIRFANPTAQLYNLISIVSI